MKKVSDYARELLNEDEVARSALHEGFLNLSAFAAKIKPQIEKRMLRRISMPSVVVALSRLKDEIGSSRKTKHTLVPEVVIKHISVQSGLSELNYEKTLRTTERAHKLHTLPHLHDDGMLLVSYGVREITLITREEHMKLIRNAFAAQRPKTILSDLSAITVSFDPNYLEIPNTIFALTRPLALRRINVIEIVSTFSELTFIVRTKDVQAAFNVLNSGH